MSKGQKYKSLGNPLINEMIAKHFKKFREDRNLSKSALTDKLGSTTNVPVNIENHGTKLSVQNYLMFCCALGINPIVLLKLILGRVADDEQEMISIDSVQLPKDGSITGLIYNDPETRKHVIKVVAKLVGGNIKGLRVQDSIKMNKTGSAIEFGLSLTMIYSIERGRRSLDVADFVLMCKLYNADCLVVLGTVIEQANDQLGV